MRVRRTMILAVFVAGLGALPLSTAEAQYYPPARRFWPFCVAVIIVTAPLRALTGAPSF